MSDGAFGWRFYATAGAVYGALMTALMLMDVPWEAPASVASSAAFFVVLGALCVWNWSECRAPHCLVSGGGYLALGAAAALVALGTLPARHIALWLLFGASLVTGLAVERLTQGPADDEPSARA